MELNAVLLVSCFLAGAALGAVFFGGLWWTVRRLPGKERPAAFLLGSFVLRGGVALAGFWLLFRTGWQGLAAALAGFLAVRLLLVRRLGPAGGRDACGDKGGQPA